MLPTSSRPGGIHWERGSSTTATASRKQSAPQRRLNRYLALQDSTLSHHSLNAVVWPAVLGTRRTFTTSAWPWGRICSIKCEPLKWKAADGLWLRPARHARNNCTPACNERCSIRWSYFLKHGSRSPWPALKIERLREFKLQDHEITQS